MHPLSAILTNEHAAFAFMAGYQAEAVLNLYLGYPSLAESARLDDLASFV